MKIEELKSIVDRKEKMINENGDLPHATVEHQLKILRQLTEFDFGKSLLLSGNCDGKSKSYLNTYKKWSKTQPIEHPLEKFLLEKAPEFRSSQESSSILTDILHKNIKNGMKVAILQCGLMDELFSLELNNLKNLQITGIDSDQVVIDQVKHKVNESKFSFTSDFQVGEASKLNGDGEFDIVIAHGLNFNVSDNVELGKLYEKFYKLLKPGGKLVTSCAQPLSALDFSDPYHYDDESAKLSKLIFYDLIECKWSNFHTECEIAQKLRQIGFKMIETFHCHINYLITFVATK